MRKNFTILTLMVWLTAFSSWAQTKLYNNTTRNFAHMGESAAQYGEYSVLGAYEDYGNTPYTGAVYMYKNGQPYRTYRFDNSFYQYMTIGRHVEVTNDWVAASAPRFNTGNGADQGAIFLARKVNGEYQTTMSYRIDLGGIAINEWARFSISGNYLVLGAPKDSQYGYQSGAVYIFQFSTSQNKWNLIQRITASDPQANANFGYSVAIDGNNIVIGAPGFKKETGKVYVFKKASGSNTFSQLAVREHVENYVSIDIYFNSRFGHSVDISGSSIIAGAPGLSYSMNEIKLVEIMEISGSNLISKGIFRNKGGNDVAIDGGRAVIADIFERSGRLHLLKKVNNEWKEHGSYIPCDVKDGDYYGYSVDIHGNNICAGLKGFDTTYTSGMVQNAGAGYLINFDSKASPVIDNASLINVPNYPAEPKQFLTPDDLTKNGFFGSTIAGDEHGDLLIVGDPEYKTLKDGYECRNGWGAVYIYNKQYPSTWKYAYKITPNYLLSASVEPKFGQNIAYKGDVTRGHTLAITAEREDYNFNTASAGAVYVYRKVNYFSEFAFLDKIHHPNPSNLGSKGFGAGGVATNATHVMVSTPGTKELSLFMVTDTMVVHRQTINIGIEGKIQGITEGNILVVTQGSIIKLFKLANNTLTEISSSAITPNYYGMQYTGKVSVNQNGMLLVMRHQYSSGNYFEGVQYVEMDGENVVMTKNYFLPHHLNYGPQPPIRDISFKQYQGFAISLSSGYRVAVYDGGPGTYKLLDIYQLGTNTQNISTENGFGKSLVFFDTEIIVGDPNSTVLSGGSSTYACHQCNNSGGKGLVSVMPIKQLSDYDAEKNATVYYKPFPVNDGYGPKFGSNVVMNKDYALVAAYGSNNIARRSGSVTLFRRNVSLMSPVTTLHDNYAAPEWGDFGYSMDMGNQYALISQPYHNWGGRVHLYDLNTIEEGSPERVFQNPNSSGYGFGTSVASWYNYVAIACPSDDKVYIYRKEGSYWRLKQTITATNPASAYGFGYSVDMDNGYLYISDPYKTNGSYNSSGSVFVYKVNSSGTFTQVGTINDPNPTSYSYFGHQVAASGNYLAVKTTYNGKGKVSIYSISGSNFYLQSQVLNDDPQAYGLDKISFAGSKLLLKSHGSEKVTLYEKSGSTFYKTGSFNAGYGIISMAQYNGTYLIGLSAYYNENEGRLYEMYRNSFTNGSASRVAETELSDEYSVSFDHENKALIYPNPSNQNKVHINIDTDLKSVKAVSPDGVSKTLSFKGNTIDVSELKQGLYSIIMETEGEIKVQQFMKL